MKIFWSWQSDNHQKHGRYFVAEVLEEVAKRVNQLDAVEEAQRGAEASPVGVDHDTKGVPGTPPIADTILKKIREAAVFVADVTPVGKTQDGKLLANPNVMIELGYAIHAIGLRRIVLVMNEAHDGRLDTLPFDLRYLRSPVTYSLKPDASSEARKEAAGTLTTQLLGRIKPSLEQAKRDAEEAAKLSSSIPELSLSLTSGDYALPDTISQHVPDTASTSLEAVKSRYPMLPIPEVDPPTGYRPSALAAMMAIGPRIEIPVAEWTRKEVAGYNARIARYWTDYEKFLSASQEHRRLMLRTLTVNLVLENSGRRPATNIDVMLLLPDGLMLFDAEKLPKAPEAPAPPALEPDPQPFSRGSPVPLDLSGIHRGPIWTKVDPAKRLVRFHVDKLKHGFKHASDSFAIAFVTEQDIAPIDLAFCISADEFPDSTNDLLRLNITLASG